MNSQPRGLKRKSCDFRFLFIFNRLPLKNARDYLQHIFLLKIYGFVMHFLLTKTPKGSILIFIKEIIVDIIRGFPCFFLFYNPKTKKNHEKHYRSQFVWP